MRNSRLVQARIEKGLSQSDLASQLGCSKQAVSNWETGYSTPPLATALKISDVLGKDVKFLFSNEVQDIHTKNKESKEVS
ncbi:helix-turn-helix transcriptional regulator [Fervidibacillus albus]|uniref:Helix-turn-helix transcriptional regulator n=1 Tax=Fervidibacillus albus TaxID=2980026 RepID=A0A9E8LV70_9BACI|nr:helix-turn-helix transcriptional regulator [Fervidibacillus albus]WAA10303.1 helix-turn-helix transcriptional regulator [Fervidibacillus albus]